MSAAHSIFEAPIIPPAVTTSSSAATVTVTFRQKPTIMCFDGTADEFIEKHGRGHWLLDGPWSSPWPLPLHQLCWQVPPVVAWWSAGK